MKKNQSKMTFTVRPLFGPIEEKQVTEQVEKQVEPIKKGPEVIAESNIDGYISKYIPDAGTDRFVLLTPDGKEYACKFYNRVTDDFVGASMLAMYHLKDHFDRNIIPMEEE